MKRIDGAPVLAHLADEPAAPAHQAAAQHVANLFTVHLFLTCTPDTSSMHITKLDTLFTISLHNFQTNLTAIVFFTPHYFFDRSTTK